MSTFSLYNRKRSKLSVPEVTEIRELYRRGEMTQGALSRHFKVSVVTIGRIVRGEVWQHLEVLDPVMSEGTLKESAARMLALQESMQKQSVEKLTKDAAELMKADKMLEELKNPLDE